MMQNKEFSKEVAQMKKSLELLQVGIKIAEDAVHSQPEPRVWLKGIRWLRLQWDHSVARRGRNLYRYLAFKQPPKSVREYKLAVFEAALIGLAKEAVVK